MNTMAAAMVVMKLSLNRDVVPPSVASSCMAAVLVVMCMAAGLVVIALSASGFREGGRRGTPHDMEAVVIRLGVNPT